MKEIKLGQDKINKFYDPRPITDETLKELGFKKYEKSGNYKDLCLGSFFLEVKEIYDKNDDEFDEETYLNNENWINWTLAVTVCQYGREVDECYNYWKTVGSVRMLIEALKGDE